MHCDSDSATARIQFVLTMGSEAASRQPAMYQKLSILQPRLKSTNTAATDQRSILLVSAVFSSVSHWHSHPLVN